MNTTVVALNPANSELVPSVRDILLDRIQESSS